MLSLFTCIKGRAALLLLLSAVTLPVSGASIEKLLMPGKLIEGHAEKESECTSCHERFSKTTQNALCLDCHDKVDADVKARKGYHGRAPEVRNAACSSCHTDHKGRDAQVVLLDKELFDHSRTDYALDGAHKRVQCSSCHKENKPWRKAPSMCIDCHKEQDVHKGDFGKKCADCHTTTTWTERKFDHSTTDFPLVDAHEKVICAACHPNQRYKKTPMDCLSCHRGDDVHRGGYGKKCDSCHRSTEWKKAKFNHNKTDFKLRDAHEKVACSACHLPGKDAKKQSTACVDCHRADDPHRGRNGKRCQDCHSTRDWGKASFDHDKDTEFPLRGPHAEATCTACHAGGVEKDAPVRDCIVCHKNDDIHQGSLGRKCDTCHNDKGWSEKVSFDHDLTRFPLYGLHALATCESCHTKGRYASLPSGCNDCHRDDDSHEGALGASCGDCHNANGWLLWRFDHEKTDFSLTGAHKELACNGCHREPPADKTPATCVSCHEADDVHRGRFGRNCSRCHSTKKFTAVRINGLLGSEGR